MSIDKDLAALAESCGILPSYWDLQGHERFTSPDTYRAILAADGIDVSSDAAIRETLAEMRRAREDRWFPKEIVIVSNQTTALEFGLGAAWSLSPDHNADIIAATGVPSDHITLPPLSSGVYVLTADVADRVEVVTVIAAPRRLPSITDITGSDRLWGLNFALYGLRSQRGLGLGDFRDLADLAICTGHQGAAFVGLNPIHAMGHCNLDAISPYSPSHRGFLNGTYIALDAIPGLDRAPDLAEFANLKNATTVQYDAHKQAHNAALYAAFDLFEARGAAEARVAFEAFVAQASDDVAAFATFESLTELHGPDWRGWPLQTGTASASRVRFHMWVQWVADTQLASAQRRASDAGMALGLYLDLAVGPRRDGAEAYIEQAAIAKDVSIGAPPDHLSPGGQNWDLAAFAPHKLQALRYAPLRRIIGQTMKHAGVIRIDHALGLNRSFWLPDDGSPGGYIRQPFEALLAIIKIEAERNKCLVIGEDLGLVPQGFRDTMRGHGFYGYSVLQYEQDDFGNFPKPQDMPQQVLSCFATHDTPTLKGYEVGRDIDWWTQLDWIDATSADGLRSERRAAVRKLAGESDFKKAVHGRLAYSSAALVAVQLDDLMSSVETQNLPGTIHEHLNWRRRYSVLVEDLADDDRIQNVAQMMTHADRADMKGKTNNAD